MKAVPSSRQVLLVDDTIRTLEQLADLLEESGYEVDKAESASVALSILARKGADISFILLDQVLDGVRDGGTKLAAQISQLRPDIFVVMYTADAQIGDTRRWEALNAGAHRYIRKANAAELLRDFGEFIEDMAELQDLTLQISGISKTRLSMFSVLVGLDVRLSVVDREYRVWFTNRDRATERKAMRCWTLFHGYSAGQGPCFGCLVKSVLETGKSQARTLAKATEAGELEWFRHDAMPIQGSGGGVERIMAVRETSQKLENLGSMGLKERLSALAASIVHQGYGRARIYSATGPDRIRCEAVATRYQAADDADYREQAVGFETEAATNVYVRQALFEKDGTLVGELDWEYGLDPASRLRIQQQPPWIDFPVFSGTTLIGWLAVDIVGVESKGLSVADIEKLRPFKEEIQRTLAGQDYDSEGGDLSRQVLAETRAALVSAQRESEALDTIIYAARSLVGRISRCLDVRIRVRQDGKLRLLRRLDPASRPTESAIDERNSESLVSYVVRFGNDLFIRDLALYEKEARERGDLPRGLVSRPHNGLAILRAKFEEQIFGTLHVECEGEMVWEPGLREALRELAEMTALLLRDIVQNQKLERAKEAAERQLEQAFGAIHGVKGPVQASRNYLETIRELHRKSRLSGKKAEELASKALVGLARIERLAVRLLRLVRENSGNREIVDVTAVLNASTKEAAILYPRVETSFTIGEDCDLIQFDPSDFGAIIDELIMNSERAGASRVEIKVGSEEDVWVIEVRDDGKGIPEEDFREKIFERWFHTFPGGAGLGLAFVKKAIEDLGGTVRAIPGLRGLCIRMMIPKSEPIPNNECEGEDRRDHCISEST